MSRAILTTFHKYTPFGGKYYEPLFNRFMYQMNLYQGEFTKLYILDSTWGITDVPSWVTVIKVDPSLRYYDAYKSVLPQIEEERVLLMDNDMVIYREGKIYEMFKWLNTVDVCSIYDTIGTYTTDKLNGKNKFCPYWFSAKTDVLRRYLSVDWAPDMPYCETLGYLTEAMLIDNLIPREFEEDKSNCLFDGIQDGGKSKDLGYYHIRSGSLPAYLLATKYEGDNETYQKYIKEQPKSEYLRQCFWYQYMGGDPTDIYTDAGITKGDWNNYYIRAKAYYCLP